MGKGALEAVPEIAEIRLSMPNKHHFLVDLTKWDLDNPNQVFYAADRPYGLIEASVIRDDAPPPGRVGGHRRLRLSFGLRGPAAAGAALSPLYTRFVADGGAAVPGWRTFRV